tara:strand:+ start:1174 stop:1512 length:339 start_codon:yes stop_codon:yes gene_type:complete
VEALEQLILAAVEAAVVIRLVLQAVVVVVQELFLFNTQVLNKHREDQLHLFQVAKHNTHLTAQDYLKQLIPHVQQLLIIYLSVVAEVEEKTQLVVEELEVYLLLMEFRVPLE